MSPILLRPVREQLEHDRVIQALQGRWGRRFEVAANLGSSQEATVRVGGTMVCPDLVLTSSKGGRRVEGVIEVETGESVNHLEAMAQWAHLGRVRAPFYLCVPAGAADVARRLCVAHNVGFAEIWSYHSVGDLLRFTMVHRHVTRGRASARAAKAAAAPARKKTSSSPRAAKKSAAKESRTKAERARTVKFGHVFQASAAALGGKSLLETIGLLDSTNADYRKRNELFNRPGSTSLCCTFWSF